MDVPPFPDPVVPPAPRPGALRLFLARLFRGVRLRDLETFYYQLATMLSAGVSLQSALGTLAARGGPDVFSGVDRGVRSGRMLSEVMAERPDVFRPFEVAMVRSGELSGRLDRNLEVAADSLRRFREIRSRMLTAMVYPLILLHLGVFLLCVPRLFAAGPGSFVLGLLTTFGPLYAAAAGLLLLHAALRDRPFYANFLLSLPGIGGIARKMALSRGARTASSLYEAGLPVAEAVRAAADSVGPGLYREAFEDASRELAAGRNLSETLAESPDIPEMMRDMIRTGEHTGHLGQTLGKLAEYYEEDAGTALDRAARIVPLVLYLAILLGLAWQVIGFWIDYLGRIDRLL